MALNKQNIHIAFNKGIDTGHDPKSVIPSKFTRLENLEQDGIDSVRQRPGYTKATLTNFSPNPAIANVRRLMALGAEVLLEADSGLHALLANRSVSRDIVTSGSIRRTFERAQVDYRDAVSTPVSVIHADAAEATTSTSTVECYVWVSTLAAGSTNLHYRLIDRTTNEVVQEGIVAIGGGGDMPLNPRVVCRESSGVSIFYIYYAWLTGGVYSLKMKSLTVN